MHGDHRVNRLKLHELEVLLAVAQAGSMAKAAAQLAMSEPAVILQPGCRLHCTSEVCFASTDAKLSMSALGQKQTFR
jgi:hypothetical protein